MLLFLSTLGQPWIQYDCLKMNTMWLTWKWIQCDSFSSMIFIMSWWSDMSSIIWFHLWNLLCLDEMICQVLFVFIYDFYYVLMKWYVKYYSVSSMNFIMSWWSDMSSIIQFYLWILLCLDEVICQVLFGFIYKIYYVLMKWYVKYYSVSSMKFIMSRWSDMSSIIRFHLWILL
jgi:hypothetical protein